ncbi:MAG: ATP-binding cassette domain-containing protein [Oscillospiraceae bacterium]|nr:ATP-binding cassette domain-containing protein [Oscillospiraceae bacterium]
MSTAEKALILRAEDISASYNKSRVINGVSFELRYGDKLALLGRNGVGKTTLLCCIMGIVKLDGGAIQFFNERKTRFSAYEISSLGVAYVPQGREIFADFTVRQNLEFGGVTLNKFDMRARFEMALEYFPALREHLSRKGGVLSGGQQQQLAIARALMSGPRLLLLDEPTEGIQPNIVAEIAEILNRVHREMHLPMILVEQNLKFAFRVANRYAVMQKGAIAASGAGAELPGEVIDKYLTV